MYTNSQMRQLDKFTEFNLEKLWQEYVQECIYKSNQEYEEKKNTETLYAMEEGIISPNPSELPMPPPAWLV